MCHKKLTRVLIPRNLQLLLNIPDFWFGFKNKHLTVDQIYRVITVIDPRPWMEMLISTSDPILTGVPHVSVLEPFLHLLYIADIPTMDNTFIGDTAIMSTHESLPNANENVQHEYTGGKRTGKLNLTR